MRRFVPLLALAVLACSTQPSLGARFSSPTAAVAFRGFTKKNPKIQSYVAVAASRGDEVRILDPGDLQPVVSPGAVFPLSIPTPPRPLLLASASLGDQDASGNPLADVLVVANAEGARTVVPTAPLTGTPTDAGPALQLVETWAATNRVAQDVSLGLAAGSQILCLAGVPADAASGRKARILVGASGGKLVVVEFTRATDGSGSVVPGTPAVKSLGFDPVDIAVAPGGATVFIATRDPISTADPTFGKIFGVAKIDASGDLVSGAVTALAAGPKDPDAAQAQIGAGTIAVAAAANVFERTVGSADASSADRFTSPRPLLVYAALDPESCGPSKPIGCGVVTLDPGTAPTAAAGNLLADPADPVANPALTPDSGPAGTLAPAQSYRAPMPIPGVPLHIAVSGPPTSGSQAVTTDPLNPGLTLLQIAPDSRKTSAVAMVSSSDGHVYPLDLSRWGPPSDVSEAGTASVTGVTAAGTVAADQYQLGLWQDLDNLPFNSVQTAPIVKVDAPGMLPAIDVWPGFTDADTWTLAYQGPLPSLSSRPGLLVTDAAGTTFAALQTTTGVLVTPVDDPSLGVLPGDFVVLEPGVCEATVAAVLQAGDVGFPAGSFPGGVLQLAPGGSGAAGAPPACAPAQLPGAGGTATTPLTVRASGLVLSNAKLGHLGRPPVARTTNPAENAFSVAWSAADLGPATTTAQRVARSVARKARRLFYPREEPCPIAADASTEGALATGCYGTGRKRLKDPLAPGPIVRFRVGLAGPNPSDPATFPPRDATLFFTTASGLTQTSRRPVTGGVGPGGAVPVDRTPFVGHENDAMSFFVPYLDDQVMVFSSVDAAGQVTSIR